MTELSLAVHELRSERNKLQAQVEVLDKAIAALTDLSGANRKRTRRTMSAAGRARIAAAQKARWAKWKAKRKAR